MAYRISREHVWVGVIEDRPNAMAEKLRALAGDGGVNLELIITRRERHGRALLFVSPLSTPEQIQAARDAGLSIADGLRNLRIEGPNAPGLGGRITTALAEAAINMRGFTAAALGQSQVTNIAFDSDGDVKQATKILEKLLAS